MLNFLILAALIYAVVYFYGRKTIKEFIFNHIAGLSFVDDNMPVILNVKLMMKKKLFLSLLLILQILPIWRKIKL